MIYRVFCPYCSLTCPFELEENEIYEVNLATARKFHLCPAALHLIDLLNHPKRLVFPRYKGEELLWREAWKLVGKGKEDAAVIPPTLTLEDALSVKRSFSRVYVDGVAADFSLLEGIVCPKIVENLENLEGVDAVFLFGDVFSLAPPVAKAVMDLKYLKREFIYSLDFYVSRTAAFASRRWIVKPHEYLLFLYLVVTKLSKPFARVKLPEGISDIEEKAASFATAMEVSWTPLFIFSSLDGILPDPYLLASLICRISAVFKDARFYIILSGANTFGLYLRSDFFMPATGEEKGKIWSFAEAVRVDASVMLGFFPNGAEFQFPVASSIESGGSFEPLPGKRVEFQPVPKVDGTRRIRELFGEPIEGGRFRQFPSSFDREKFEERFNAYLEWFKQMKEGKGLLVIEERVPVSSGHALFLPSRYLEAYPKQPLLKLSPQEEAGEYAVLPGGEKLKVVRDRRLPRGIALIERPWGRKLGLLERKEGIYFCRRQEFSYE